MRAMRRFALLLVPVVACGGGSKSAVQSPTGGDATGAGANEVANPIPHTKGPDCAVVADRAATVAHAETPDRQGEARDLFRTHCTEDKWADDARSCFGTVETDDELHGCMKLLTQAQRDRVHKAAPPDMAPKGGSNKATTAAPPPPGGSDKPKGTRGARTSSDPCEGGEKK